MEGDGSRRRHPRSGRGARCAGDELRGRLRRHGSAAAGERQLPAGGDPVGGRTTSCGWSATLTCRRRAARSCRCEMRRRTGCLVNAQAPGGRGGREHRDVEPDRGRRAWRRSARRDAGPRQGQGTMNNVSVRQRPLHLLRDGRRRPGCEPATATGPSARPRGDVEHAEHADRGAGARVSAADRALRAAPRHRRCGPSPRRRRSCPRLPGAGGLPRLADDRAPQARARRGGRRRRPVRWARTG